MARLRKHIYSPHTVVLDMEKQPDAEVMLKIAQSIKGTKVEIVKKGRVVKIHYPKRQDNFRLQIYSEAAKNLGRMFVSHCNKKENADDNESASDSDLYHAMILK